MSNARRFNLRRFPMNTSRNISIDEFSVFIEFDGSVSDNHLVFGASIDVDDLFSYLSVFNDAIRRFDKAIIVDSGVSRKVKNETDVAALRGFDGTDATVMGRVGIADIEAGAFASQTARAHRRKTAFMRKFRERVSFVHELGKLGRSEELFNRGNDRTGV